MEFPAYKAINKAYGPFVGCTEKCIMILGPGAIGKTFLAVSKTIYRSIKYNETFAFVVESPIMAQNLTGSNGAKFFTRLLAGWAKHGTKLFKRLDIFFNKPENFPRIKNDAIMAGDRIIGYLVAYNDYAHLKGSNLIINRIVVDEFIPEKLTYMNRDIDIKITSLFESLGRDDLNEIIFLANPIRLKTPLLTRFGFGNIKPGETLQYKVDGKPLVVCHYIDINEHVEFFEAKKETLASKFATATGNDYRLLGIQAGLNKTTEYVKPPVRPSNIRIVTQSGIIGIHYISNRIVITDITHVSLNGCTNITTPFKHKVAPGVIYNKANTENLLNQFANNRVQFCDDNAYVLFKDLIGVK